MSTAAAYSVSRPGQAKGSAIPATSASPDQAIGRRAPTRSIIRPAGTASSIGSRA